MCTHIYLHILPFPRSEILRQASTDVSHPLADLIYPKTINKYGIYSVKFFINGKWRYREPSAFHLLFALFFNFNVYATYGVWLLAARLVANPPPPHAILPVRYISPPPLPRGDCDPKKLHTGCKPHPPL